jgi:hypothetical protein
MYTHGVIKVHNINFRENLSVGLGFLSTERGVEVYIHGEVNEPIFATRTYLLTYLRS